jgi:AAA15 family ATPase/GTPase
MKILKIGYQDREYNWRYDAIEFHSDLTLLVGISGAGKTQIIKSILNLKRIANGVSLNGVAWLIEFQGKDDVIYKWEGEFETKNIGFQFAGSESNKENVNIVTEKLARNDTIIVERTRESIWFNGVKIPKLSPTESILHLLKLEDDISLVYQEINKIYFADPDGLDDDYGIPLATMNKIEKSDLSTIIEKSDPPFPIKIKLFLAAQKEPELFSKIKENFINIFPEIEDIEIKILGPEDLGDIPINLAQILSIAPMINIKEKGVDTWIKQPNISTGMLKTLMYLSYIYLSPKDSLILIDEIENGLGVNCLDSVIENLQDNRPKNCQFIITSHHPYTINNISPQHWKIVTRKGGLVAVQDAKEWGISSSRQKAFIDLQQFPMLLDTILNCI